MKKSTRKAKIVNKNLSELAALPLLLTNPQAALLLLSLIGQAQFSIEDLLGKLSRQFMEQLLMMGAESVAGPKSRGR